MRAFLLVACVLMACAPASRLEGYDTLLCSGDRAHEQVGVDLGQREYGMIDFRSSFAYCSTTEYYCMTAPLLISVPKDAAAEPPDQAWEIEGIAFNYERGASGFQIRAVSPTNELVPGTEITSVFSREGNLLEVIHRSPQGDVEVQRVCRGQINLDDLF